MENMKAIQTVINKAWNDDDFRSTLVANPKKAIEKATGEKVPNSLEMVVSDQTDTNTIYINIPPKPDFDNMELTDEQLEQVAGGEVAILAGVISLTVAAGIGATGAAAGAAGGVAAAGIAKGW